LLSSYVFKCTAVLIYFGAAYRASLYWQYLVLSIHRHLLTFNHRGKACSTYRIMATRNENYFSGVSEANHTAFRSCRLRHFFVVFRDPSFFGQTKYIEESETSILIYQALSDHFNIKLRRILVISCEYAIIDHFDICGCL